VPRGPAYHGQTALFVAAKCFAGDPFPASIELLETEMVLAAHRTFLAPPRRTHCVGPIDATSARVSEDVSASDHYPISFELKFSGT